VEAGAGGALLAVEPAPGVNPVVKQTVIAVRMTIGSQCIFIRNAFSEEFLCNC
jgi:hypothetical protein